MPSQGRHRDREDPNGHGHEHRHQAAQYLQRLEDGRTFVRYAERAFNEAVELAPDMDALQESTALRDGATQLRRKSQEFKQKGLSRFNPKRQMRRVVIDPRPS